MNKLTIEEIFELDRKRLKMIEAPLHRAHDKFIAAAPRAIELLKEKCAEVAQLRACLIHIAHGHASLPKAFAQSTLNKLYDDQPLKPTEE